MKYVIYFVLFIIAYIVVGGWLINHPIITLFFLLGVLFIIWGIEDFRKMKNR